MVSHLILTTLAGEETQLTVELQEYDRFYEFENAVLEQLPNIGESSTFGCELDFVCRDTHEKLVDPMWNTLRTTIVLLSSRAHVLRRPNIRDK